MAGGQLRGNGQSAGENHERDDHHERGNGFAAMLAHLGMQLGLPGELAWRLFAGEKGLPRLDGGALVADRRRGEEEVAVRERRERKREYDRHRRTAKELHDLESFLR